MYAIVGTAGHVDHGKSLLIQALTGHHPSHLPQELERGMTIDLGFAHFTSSQGDKIGIIDVPGHERFLRNMVSSVWGLDLILFIVAADEGWAALSEEHLRVISALGIRDCIVVINKCDLVSAERVDEVEEVILERFLALNDNLPPLVRVSALTGAGIDELKQTIVDKVQQLSAKEELSDFSHIYVDRVFSVTGIGTTITGTLRGGPVELDQSLILYPSGQSVRIRSMQSYHQTIARAEPRSRVALGLKQVKRDLVSRGSCLVSKEVEISLSCDWLVKLQPEFNKMKKQCEVEVAVGTAHSLARCYLLADGQIARLQLRDPIPAFWGQPLLLLMPGGGRIVGAGRLVWPHGLKRGQQQAVTAVLSKITFTDPRQSQQDIELVLNGFVSAAGNLRQPNDSVELGGWWFAKPFLQQLVDRISQQLTKANTILVVETLAQQYALPVDVLKLVIQQQCQQKHWQLSIEGLSLFGQEQDLLTEEQQALYCEIEATGRAFFNAYQQQRPQLQKQLQALMRKKLIIPMEYNLYVATNHYQLLVKELMAGRQIGEQFSIADARDRVNISRKPLIPLLNRLERDGWLRRVGDLREVRKHYVAE